MYSIFFSLFFASNKSFNLIGFITLNFSLNSYWILVSIIKTTAQPMINNKKMKKLTYRRCNCRVYVRVKFSHSTSVGSDAKLMWISCSLKIRVFFFEWWEPKKIASKNVSQNDFLTEWRTASLSCSVSKLMNAEPPKWPTSLLICASISLRSLLLAFNFSSQWSHTPKKFWFTVLKPFKAFFLSAIKFYSILKNLSLPSRL